jgi:CubicO group peptidase (beta-lactamase class C family)
MIKRFIIASTILFVANLSFAQTPVFVSDSLEKYIERGMSLWQVPGLAISIVKDGKVIFQKGFGIRDINKKDKVDENTLFIIASNSKLFTGTAIANLDYEKKLSLNDKIIRHLPWFRLYDSAVTQMVTVRDVLSHRLGTKTFQGDFVFWNSNLPKDSIVWKMRYLKPNGLFRQDYGYCNSGYLVAGQVLQKVIGQSWETYTEENILKPLGMSNTYMQTAGMANRKNVASPHTNLFSALTTIPFDNVDNLAPATSMVSNVKDVSKWLMMQLDSGRYEGRRILPWPVLQKTRDANITVSNRKNQYYPNHFRTYGLGVLSADYNGRQIFWHTGGAFGFVTNTCFVPEENLGITIMTNNDNQSFYEALRYQILDAYLDVPYVDRSKFLSTIFTQNQKRKEAELKKMDDRVNARNSFPISLDDYTDDYYNTVYGKINISKNNKGQLVCSFQHHPHLKGTMDYMDNSEFRMTYSNLGYGIYPAKFIITNGKATGVEISVNEFLDLDTYVFEKDPLNLMIK